MAVKVVCILVFLIVLLERQTISVAAAAAAASTTKCTIDVSKDLTASSPLFLHPRSLEIVYPSKTTPRILSFSSGDEHILQCFGGELQPILFSTNDLSKCINGKTFSSVSKHKDYSIDQIHCSKNPDATMREDKSRKCENGIVVNIGYQLNSDKFLTTIDLCYVDELATTRWAHSKIPGAVGGFRSKEPQVAAFSKGNYFKSVLMGRVYPRNYQVQTFMQIFDGNQEMVDKYLPSTGDKKNYFVKGHLVARADKFYHAEQHSTYFYVNALPMWQSINNGNWRSVESTVRRIAGIVGDIDVWTGGLDVLKLSGKEIFLTTDKKNNKRRLVPAPKLLFKLVHDAKNNEALVFVTVNNPYVDESTAVPNEYKICEEYRECAEKFKQFQQIYQGYTYCCTYADFVRNSMDFLPVDIRNPKPLTLH